MLKTKRGLTSKPSKPSLISRGLSSNITRQGSKKSSLDGCYSLYSTDSEDNVVGVSKGLDKCAELLTNILEINGEKGTQKTLHTAGKPSQSLVLKNRKQKVDSSSKPASNKERGWLRSKRKPRTSIHVPTASTQTPSPAPGNLQLSKAKPAYNERVTASTPVLSADQRKRQQELQYRERILEEQINLLQTQYENLQKQNTGQSTQESHPQLQMGTLCRLLNTSQEKVNDKNISPGQGTKLARKSLDFTNNAEKPFIYNFREHKDPGMVTDPIFSVMQNETNPEGVITESSEMRKVQFEKQKQCGKQESSGQTPETSQLDLSEPATRDSPTTSILRDDGSTGLSQDMKKERSENRRNPSKTDGVPKHQSPSRNTDHLRILIYLVGELKAVLGNSGDVEVERLLMEIENEIRLLSYSLQSFETPPVRGCAAKQHDIDTEIALQPLRSENSDLRRKLRIANQRLREVENQRRQVPEKDRTNEPNENLIESLHHQLVIERQSMEKLRHEKEQVEKRFTTCSKDNITLQHLLSEKEKQLQTGNEELERQKSKVMAVDNQAKLQLESVEITLRARNKEVGLLNLALQQRDAEIERLTELTRGLQQSLTRVLTNVQDLHPDNVISDVSTIPSFLDSLRPSGQRATKSSVGLMAPGSCVNELQPWDNFDDRQEIPRDEGAGDSDDKKADGRGNENVDQLRDSHEDESADDASLSLSSADEVIFKQELANLDTLIARLQDSLRGKV